MLPASLVLVERAWRTAAPDHAAPPPAAREPAGGGGKRGAAAWLCSAEPLHAAQARIGRSVRLQLGVVAAGLAFAAFSLLVAWPAIPLSSNSAAAALTMPSTPSLDSPPSASPRTV